MKAPLVDEGWAVRDDELFLEAEHGRAFVFATRDAARELALEWKQQTTRVGRTRIVRVTVTEEGA